MLGNLIGRVHARKIKRHGLWFDTTARPNFIKSSIFWGLYERSETKYLKRYLRRDLPVVELGASLGYVTGHLAMYGTNAVIAIEANPGLIANLNGMVELNDFHQITVQNMCIDYSGRKAVPFQIDTGGLGSKKTASESAGTVFVKTATLSEIKRSHNLARYVLVSDIEGAEIEIFLQETDQSVIDDCMQIFIELHETQFEGKAYSPVDLSQIIKNKWQMKEVLNDGKVWIFDRQ